MKKIKFYKSTILIAALLILSGCVERGTDGQPTGLIWELFGAPAEKAILWFAQLLGGQVGSYALGIIFVTIIARIIIAPLNIGMSKASFESSERMSYIKPLMDKITNRAKNAQSMEERAAIQSEQMALQKVAGVKIISAQGCLPLFIQLPIFSAMYAATVSSPLINNDKFLGVSLSQPSLIFGAIAAGLYYIQGLISQIGMSEEQKAMNRTVLLVTPITQLLLGLNLPAGANLYFVAGAIIVCLTTVYTSLVLRPKIKEKVATELANNQELNQWMQRKDVTASPKKDDAPSNYKIVDNKRRNIGKQKR